MTSSLRAAEHTIEVDPEILQLAAGRCNVSGFAIPPAVASFSLRRVEASLPGWERLVAAEDFGEASLSASAITVRINETKWAAEAALRVVFQVSIARQGGLLLHSSSVRFGDKAIVAVGHSTAGKSTLAALCREAGGQLLSDEMTALFPDGTVYGTPFRSSDPTPGHPGPAKLGLFVLLDKAPHEALSPIPPEKALPRILEQVYRGYDGGELTPARILERVAGAMNVCPPQVLSFRKHPDAGHFVRQALERL